MYEVNIYHTPYTYPITGHTTKKNPHIEETFKCTVRFLYFNRNVVTDTTLYSALR